MTEGIVAEARFGRTFVAYHIAPASEREEP